MSAKTYDDVRAVFLDICRTHGMHPPTVHPARASDPCDYTSAERVRLNVEAAPDVSANRHAAHVFGHWICCVHAVADAHAGGAMKTDQVADLIADLVEKPE